MLLEDGRLSHVLGIYLLSKEIVENTKNASCNMDISAQPESGTRVLVTMLFEKL